MFMRVSSDPNNVFHLVSSEDINVINRYMEKSPSINNTPLPQGKDSSMEIQEFAKNCFRVEKTHIENFLDACPKMIDY